MSDLYATTTARIIEALEQGTPPWVRPWSTIPEAIPMNAQSRRPYRGINFTMLSLEAARYGYPVNRWLTFRQALDLGAHVRKGEQGTPIVFWQLRRIGVVSDAFPEHDDDPPELRGKVYPLLRSFTVFNVAQTDGLDPRNTEPSVRTWVPEAKAEELLLMSGARFRIGGARAFYQPASDEIHLPAPAAFPNASSYYNVALHELTHWSGHPARCNRDLGGRFGDSSYAVEELIAELGSAYTMARLELELTPRVDHAQYLQSWLRVLKADKRAIFTAASAAQKAADFLVQLSARTVEVAA
jgi:antirestriction protein ArdC